MNQIRSFNLGSEKMSFKKLFNYMVIIFISGLGLFNSTQLEVRYEPGTNNELFFQNGQIISTAFMGLFIAAFFVEILIMKKNGASTSSDKKIRRKEKESKNSEKKSGDKKSDDKKPDDKKPEVDSSEIIIENNVPKTD
jgi:cytochrome b subunit of formate dehydrogenase